MTPESQRIAIAEACVTIETWKHPDTRCLSDLPDYLNDLNAMHEAEKVLTEEQARRLNDILFDSKIELDGSVSDYVWHATATQRAEAFLRTLNLWKE